MKSHEQATASDAARLAAAVELADRLGWSISWRVLKYHSLDAHEITPDTVPDEVAEFEGNGLLNAGIGVLIDRLVTDAPGVNSAAFSSANARLKVGNGTTAFSAAHTDLQGGSTATAAMDGGFPSVAGQVITWQATFGAGVANFAWEEVGVQNGAGAINGTTVKMLNRRVGALGTKASGTWVLQATVTIS